MSSLEKSSSPASVQQNAGTSSSSPLIVIAVHPEKTTSSAALISDVGAGCGAAGTGDDAGDQHQKSSTTPPGNSFSLASNNNQNINAKDNNNNNNNQNNNLLVANVNQIGLMYSHSQSQMQSGHHNNNSLLRSRANSGGPGQLSQAMMLATINNNNNNSSNPHGSAHFLTQVNSAHTIFLGGGGTANNTSVNGFVIGNATPTNPAVASAVSNSFVTPPLDRDFLPLFGPNQLDQQRQYMKQQLALHVKVQQQHQLMLLQQQQQQQLQNQHHSSNQSASTTSLSGQQTQQTAVNNNNSNNNSNGSPLRNSGHHSNDLLAGKNAAVNQNNSSLQFSKDYGNNGGSPNINNSNIKDNNNNNNNSNTPISHVNGLMNPNTGIMFMNGRQATSSSPPGSPSLFAGSPQTGLLNISVTNAVGAGSPYHSPSQKKQKIVELCTAEIRRTNQHKISRTKGVAEKMCSNAIERYLRANEDEGYVLKMMRRIADEYFLACSEFASVCPLPPNITSRFGDLQDEFHELVRFGYGAGQQERYNTITHAVSALEKEVQKILFPVALEILACCTPPTTKDSISTAPATIHDQQKELSHTMSNINMVSNNTFVDTANGIVIQKWDSCHKGARRYCKSLQKLASAWLNQNFAIPYVLVIEVCGVTFSATSITPLARQIRDVSSFTEWNLAIESVTSERGFPVDKIQDLVHNCRFAAGSDGKVYCYHAAGLMMPTVSCTISGNKKNNNNNNSLEFLSPQLLDAYDGPIEETIQGQEKQFARTRANALEKVVDAVRTKQVGVANSHNFGPIRTLKEHGLEAKDITALFSALYEKDAQYRKAVAAATGGGGAGGSRNGQGGGAGGNGAKPKRDRDLQDALVTTAAEILGRVLRIIVREYWAEQFLPMIVKSRHQLRKLQEEALTVENLGRSTMNTNNNNNINSSPTNNNNNNSNTGQTSVPGSPGLHAATHLAGSSVFSGASPDRVLGLAPVSAQQQQQQLVDHVDQVVIQMSVFTHQLVELLLIEGSSARPNPEDQLYLHIVELAKQVFPERHPKFNPNSSSSSSSSSSSAFFREPVNTKTWNETMLSIVHIAEHLAEKLGMTFTDGILCFANRYLGRVVRTTTLQAPKSWFRSAVAGLHKDNLKLMATKLQHVVSSDRPDLPESFGFFVALRQCDFVNQAQETPGVPSSGLFLSTNVAPLIPQPDDDDDDDGDGNDSHKNKTQEALSKKNNKKSGDNDDDSGDDLFQDTSQINASAALARDDGKNNNNSNQSSSKHGMANTILQTCFSHYLKFTAAMQKVSRANVAIAHIASTTTPQRIALAVSAKAIIAAQNKNGEKPKFDALNLSTITQGSLPGAPISAIPKNMTQEMWETAMAIVDEMQKEVEMALEDIKEFFKANAECRKLFEQASDPLGAVVPSAFVCSSAMLATLIQQKLRLLVNIARDVCHEKIYFEFAQMLKDLDLLANRGIITKDCGTGAYISVMDSAVALYIHPLTLEANRRDCLTFSRRKVDFAEQLFGQHSIQWAAAVADVGALNMKLGDLEAARSSYERAFTRLREIAPNHATTLAAANNLGCILFRMAHTRMDPRSKRLRLASLHFRFPHDVDAALVDAVIALQYVVLRSAHADAKTLSDTYSNIGSICVYRGRYGKALPYFEEALKLTRGLMSDTHPERASIIRNRIMCEKRIQAAASVRIACHFKGYLARKELKKRRAVMNALLLIQAVGRGYCRSRKRVQDRKNEFYTVATIIASPSRGGRVGGANFASPMTFGFANNNNNNNSNNDGSNNSSNQRLGVAGLNSNNNNIIQPRQLQQQQQNFSRNNNNNNNNNLSPVQKNQQNQDDQRPQLSPQHPKSNNEYFPLMNNASPVLSGNGTPESNENNNDAAIMLPMTNQEQKFHSKREFSTSSDKDNNNNNDGENKNDNQNRHAFDDDDDDNGKKEEKISRLSQGYRKSNQINNNNNNSGADDEDVHSSRSSSAAAASPSNIRIVRRPGAGVNNNKSLLNQNFTSPNYRPTSSSNNNNNINNNNVGNLSAQHSGASYGGNPEEDDQDF